MEVEFVPVVERLEYASEIATEVHIDVRYGFSCAAVVVPVDRRPGARQAHHRRICGQDRRAITAPCGIPPSRGRLRSPVRRAWRSEPSGQGSGRPYAGRLDEA